MADPPVLAPPVMVRIVDVDRPIGDIEATAGRTGQAYRTARLIARYGGRPVGSVDVKLGGDGRADAKQVEEAIERDLGAELLHRRSQDGSEDRSSGVGPLVSVVITTCGDTDPLVRCVEAVLQSAYPQVEIVVVDNRPANSPVRAALGGYFGDPRVRVIDEPVQGLSRARNAGLANARGEIVAFTDDDTVADRDWITWIERAFAHSSAPACVTGLILPLELETSEQITLEQFARFGKGFEPRIFDLARRPVRNPLFPYASGQFGSGANIALRADFGRRIRGFDPHLGAGTPAQGGEDLDLCIRVLLAGERIAYEPAAIVLHQHPDGHGRLRRQAFRYGVGLSAMLAKQLAVGSDRRGLLRAVPAGIRYLYDRDSPKHAAKTRDFPASLERLERLGMLCGPLAYLKSRVSRPSHAAPRAANAPAPIGHEQ